MQNKTPYKLLLHQQLHPTQSPSHHRTSEQIQTLSELIVNNSIFDHLNLPKQYTRDISNHMTLIWADHPHINTVADNEIYLILDGKAFEFMHNKSFSQKAKLDDNSDYIMLRKLQTNDFFIGYFPPRKYSQSNHNKYHLMVDQQTLLGKISGNLFQKTFLPAIEERWRKINIFSKKVNLLNSLPVLMVYQLSRYFQKSFFPKGSSILKREEKSQNIYFIESGEIDYKIFAKSRTIESPHKNYKASFQKNFKKQILKENDSFGIDRLNDPQAEAETGIQYSADTKTQCTLYQIDKRILAIVISSFDDAQQKSAKKYASINLNDQISGQGYQSIDQQVLIRNAQMIKTSEKKIRDIKLRYLHTSKKSRTPNYFDNNQPIQAENSGLGELKYGSCHSLQKIKANQSDTMKFSQTFTTKFRRSALRSSSKNFYQIGPQKNSPQLSKVVLSAFNDNEFDEYGETMNIETKQNQTFRSTAKSSGFVSKKKNSILSFGKEESDIIRSYLEKKLKNQMIKKASDIAEVNKNKAKYSKVKRLFNNPNPKSKTPIKKSQSCKQVSVTEQLYQRMNKLHQNPLLSLVESQRRKLEYNTKITQRITKDHQKNVKKPAQNRKSNGLILISNN